MAGLDGHRGWIYYVAVAPEHQATGIGRSLMDEAERRLQELGCPKVNVRVRAENAAVATFYEQLGYAREERVCPGKLLTENA